MSDDTTQIETPSGKTVVIRTYTTRADDKAAKALLSEGTTITQNGIDGDQVFSVTLAAQDASDAEYVRRLVQSIDGNADNISQRLETLRSDDYDAIDAAVKKVTSVPKATSKS